MAYPTAASLPANWQILSEERRFAGSETTTNWYVLADGKRLDAYLYHSHEAAERRALARAEMDAVDAVIEQIIGQERHYGIRVWSEANPACDTPTWKLTDPHKGHEGHAFAWYSHTPPPVDVYTRAQYETACAALELDAASDAEIDAHDRRYGRNGTLDLWISPPREVIAATLRRRRLAGMDREQAERNAGYRRELETACLARSKAYSRAQYEQACRIMHLRPLSDGGCLALVDQDLSRLDGSGVTAIIPGLPTDKVSLGLAYKRVAALDHAAAEADHRCDECGAFIAGSGMIASGGLACGPDCYDAMSDRPGRYAGR